MNENFLKDYLEKNIENQNKILEKLETIEKNNMMMQDHIVFVNSVYNRIKAPFFYIMNMVESLRIGPQLLDTVDQKKENQLHDLID